MKWAWLPHQLGRVLRARGWVEQAPTSPARVAAAVRRAPAERPVPEVVASPSRQPAPRLRPAMPVSYDGTVAHPRRSVRARALQRLARVGLKPVLTHMPLSDRTIRALRTIDRLSAHGPRSRFVEQVRFDLGGVPAEQMVHRYGPDSDMTVLYLHGGAFISGGIETHRRICERLAQLTGATVISLDYVQLPEGHVGDSVRDAIAAYTALVAQLAEPAKIVVAGDSAGGYLAMKIAELASRRGLQAPAAVLTFSPLLSLDPDRGGKVEAVIDASDAYLPISRLAEMRRWWLPPGASIEGHTSPLNAVQWITSPTFIVCADDEMLRPEAEAMANRLADRGVGVEFHLFRRQVHAFAVLADALPESRKALELAAAFARAAVGEAEPFDAELLADEPEIIDHPDLVATVVGDSRDRAFWRRWFEAS